MNKKNLIFSVLGLGVVALVGIWYFIFYRPSHFKRDVADEQAIVVSAVDIVKEYQANEDASNKKYLNKAVEVTGELLEAKKNEVGNPVLSIKGVDAFSGVSCTLKGTTPVEIKSGTTITVKGVVTGFLSDVTIIEAIITKP